MVEQKPLKLFVVGPNPTWPSKQDPALIGGFLLELQYGFDFIADCDIKYRLGHLLVLVPKFQAIADAFPPAKEGDSRTTQVNPPVEMKAGEVLATSVGVTKGGVNTFFDWGVYDLRTKNSPHMQCVGLIGSRLRMNKQSEVYRGRPSKRQNKRLLQIELTAANVSPDHQKNVQPKVGHFF